MPHHTVWPKHDDVQLSSRDSERHRRSAGKLFSDQRNGTRVEDVTPHRSVTLAKTASIVSALFRQFFFFSDGNIEVTPIFPALIRLDEHVDRCRERKGGKCNDRRHMYGVNLGNNLLHGVRLVPFRKGRPIFGVWYFGKCHSRVDEYLYSDGRIENWV